MKISVIIPVYNVAPYLRACLDSVVAAVVEFEKVGGEKRWTNGSCHLVEVICLDDGSTDGSGEILDEYAERVNSSSCEFEREGGVGEENGKASAVHLHLISSPVFRVLHQQNAGVSAARNAALEVATGEWICFVDADDCVHPDLLRRLCVAANKYKDADLLSIELRCFETTLPVVDNCAENEYVVDITHRIPYVIDERGFWQFVYRKSLIEDIRFPAYVMGEDRLFKTWALIRARMLVCLVGVSYYYRCRLGSAINSQWNWRKWHDDMCHSIRRLVALITCAKYVEWRIYRHQYGLLLRLMQQLGGVVF